MLKSALFFLLGVAVGGAATLHFISHPSNYERGIREGEIRAKLSMAETIKTLGPDDHQSADGRNVAFAVKGVVAVTVERNGVKTLRLTR